MPKGKKKGAGGMKKGASEEGKMALMQQRASMEQEMAKKKEEMLAQFLKDKLQKEERNSMVNQHKLTQRWREVLRTARAEELCHDVDMLSQTFERVLDCKNSVIKKVTSSLHTLQSLVCDLDEAKEQASRAVRAHLQRVDDLMQTHRTRLALLEQQWASELDELSKEFNTERELIVSQHQASTAYLQDVSYAMEQDYKELKEKTLKNFLSTRDDIVNRNMEEMHVLQMHLDTALEERWQQAQQALHSYTEATLDRKIAYKNLSTSDQRSAQEIDAQMKKIQKIQDSISALRARLSAAQRESKAEVSNLRAARDEVVVQSRLLRSQLSHVRAGERRQLSNLVMHSSGAAKKLQAIIHKGEKLLRLSEMCRKMESEQEKVLPFYSLSLSAEEEELVKARVTEELAKAMQDYSDLELFWQRYNKALLQRTCLERERAELGQENKHLRLLLRQYLDGISVSDEVLRRQNPLLMVGRPTLTVPAAARTNDTRKRPVVVEAAHVVKHSVALQ